MIRSSLVDESCTPFAPVITPTELYDTMYRSMLQVVTMFSNDTMMVQGILFALSDLLILPFTIAIGIYLVYREV
jgi:hypothetical protein